MSRISDPVAIAVFDIDGVLRDVSGSYQRALADTVEKFTDGQYRPTDDEIDTLKGEGLWNNDWEASQELVYRFFEQQGQTRDSLALNYEAMVDFFQSRYRGPNQADPDQWTGYISQEPLLADLAYFESLSNGGVAWGFFSGATRGSASYILERRMGVTPPGSDRHGGCSRQARSHRAIHCRRKPHSTAPITKIPAGDLLRGHSGRHSNGG